MEVIRRFGFGSAAKTRIVAALLRSGLTIVILAGLWARLAAPLPPGISPENSRKAVEKIERIAGEQMRPGETISLTEDEINSLLRYDYAHEVPEGVRDVRVRLLQDTGIADALVDVAKLQASSGGSFSPFWMAVFRGERRLKATCRYVSSNGLATVEIVSAEIDGTTVPEPILDWLVASVVSDSVPGFELGKPTPLPNNLREIRLEPERAIIVSN